MSYKIVVLVCVFVFFILLNSITKCRIKVLSLFLIIALSGFPLFSLGDMGSITDRLGGLGSNIYIFPSTFMSFLILIRPYKYKIYVNKWLSILLIVFFAVNVINPSNIYPKASWVFVVVVFQLLLLLYSIKTRFSNEEVFVSLYEAITCWLVFEFILTICYPILGMQSVLTYFHGELAEKWALRREGYPSAVGSYSHPARLAFVCAVSFCMYTVAYFNEYKKNISLLLAGCSLFVIYFTFSRTTYVAIFASYVIIFLAHKGVRLNYKAPIYIASLFALCYIFILYIPVLNKIFLQSDSDQMLDARMIHWQMGYEMWMNHFWLGVGINSHVHYMQNSIFASIQQVADFFFENPIHNVHIQVLAETGIIGLAVWLALNWWQIIKSYIYAERKNYYTNGAMLRLSVLLFSFLYCFFGWTLLDYSVLFPTVLTAFSLSIIPKKIINNEKYTCYYDRRLS